MFAERAGHQVPAVAFVSSVAHHGNRWTNGSAFLYCLWTVVFYVPKHLNSQLEKRKSSLKLRPKFYLSTNLALRQLVELQTRRHKYDAFPTAVDLEKACYVDCLS
jgi:hypothetical protein